MVERQARFKNTRRWVIKVGSALVTANGKGLDRAAIASWVEQMVWLRAQGIEVVLVSSGAVAEGVARLGLPGRPSSMHELQAAAAVGQMGLVQVYESNFSRYGCHAAQILLTHDDLSDRGRYLNARNTLLSLVQSGVVPVVNENDTVATDEIRFGDNDTLAALVANLLQAEVLLILTDQDGMFDADPRKNPQAKLISETKALDPALRRMASGSVSGLGRGGMATKVDAAVLASRSGAYTVVAHGREPNVMQRVYQGEALGTLFLPEQEPIAARKQWLAGHLQMKGTLVLDAGAVKVLKETGSSLLAVGVLAVEGGFERGEMVVCVDEQGERVACGLVNYPAIAASKIRGQSSACIEEIL
ncbi:MAG: glutamate 5-kinase, partial [Gammaproteobacteria bacterium]